MAAAPQPPSSDPPAERRLDSGRPPTESGPRLAYRAALARYKRSKLADIRLAQGMQPGSGQVRPAANADEITEYLDRPAAARALIARLSAARAWGSASSR